MEKFTPSFTPEYFKSLLREVGAQQLYEEVERVIFDPEYMAKRVVLDEGKNLVQARIQNRLLPGSQRKNHPLKMNRNAQASTKHLLRKRRKNCPKRKCPPKSRSTRAVEP